jgi:hypothetical protein
MNENTFGSRVGITVTMSGSGTLSLSGNGSLLRIGKEQTVIAKDLTLKGRDANNAPVVSVGSGGAFRMEGSAKVTGKTSPSNNGAVYVNGGTFTIRDSASVSGNTASDGGGVYVNGGTFDMESGAISGNTGRGVHVGERGTFTMKDGAISGNTSNGVNVNSGTFTMQGGAISGNASSGVYVGGTFTMKDGAISGNTTSSGGGVYVSSGTFTLEGGAILGNTASYGGGGVYVSGGTFTMKDGVISGNTATGSGGGLYHKGGTFTKTGGTIYGDDAAQNLKNTVMGIGHAVYETKNGEWRNASAGPTVNPGSYGFWLNEGEAVKFPSHLTGTMKRETFDNSLTIAENVIKSSSSNYVWVLQSVSGDAYTLKRKDAANTMTLTIKKFSQSRRFEEIGRFLTVYFVRISGDSGSGQDNWNGDWYTGEVTF